MKNLVLSLVFLSLLFSCEKETITPASSTSEVKEAVNEGFRTPVYYISNKTTDCRNIYLDGSIGFTVDVQFQYGYPPVFYYRVKGSTGPFKKMRSTLGGNPVINITSLGSHARRTSVYFTPDPMAANGCYEIMMQRTSSFDEAAETLNINSHEYWEYYSMDNPNVRKPRGFELCCSGDVKGDPSDPIHTQG